MKTIFASILIITISAGFLNSQTLSNYQNGDSLRYKILTDFGYYYSLNRPDNHDHLISFDLAYLSGGSNITFGPNIQAIYNFDSGISFAFKFRIRKYLSNNHSIDLAPGYDFTNSGLTLSLDYRLSNHLALSAQILPERDFDEKIYTVNLGAKIGGKVGIIAGIISTGIIIFASNLYN